MVNSGSLGKVSLAMNNPLMKVASIRGKLLSSQAVSKTLLSVPVEWCITLRFFKSALITGYCSLKESFPSPNFLKYHLVFLPFSKSVMAISIIFFLSLKACPQSIATKFMNDLYRDILFSFAQILSASFSVLAIALRDPFGQARHLAIHGLQ